MSNAFQLKTQNYCLAIRRELGYPLVQWASDCTAFASGGLADVEKAMQICAIAQASKKDFVYTAWDGVADKEPASIAIAIREMLTVDWVDRVFLWTADEQAPLMMVATSSDEHLVVGARGLLERRRGRPAKNMSVGKKIAMRRVRRAATAMDYRLLQNNTFVPRGASWSEPEAQPADCVVRFL